MPIERATFLEGLGRAEWNPFRPATAAQDDRAITLFPLGLFKVMVVKKELHQHRIFWDDLLHLLDGHRERPPDVAETGRLSGEFAFNASDLLGQPLLFGLTIFAGFLRKTVGRRRAQLPKLLLRRLQLIIALALI